MSTLWLSPPAHWMNSSDKEGVKWAKACIKVLHLILLITAHTRVIQSCALHTEPVSMRDHPTKPHTVSVCCCITSIT